MFATRCITITIVNIDVYLYKILLKYIYKLRYAVLIVHWDQFIVIFQFFLTKLFFFSYTTSILGNFDIDLFSYQNQTDHFFVC